MTARRPSVILFDVMSTLVYDPIVDEIPAYFDLTLEELYGRKHPSAWQRFERGKISETTFYDIYLPGRPDPIDGPALREVLYEAYRWIDGMESMLIRLDRQDVEIHAFSNYPVWHQIIEDKLQLSRYLDWTFVSCKTGLRKPDKAAYRHVLESLDVEASDCLFVDDRRDNCRAARGVGMDSIVFENARKLKHKLDLD